MAIINNKMTLIDQKIDHKHTIFNQTNNLEGGRICVPVCGDISYIPVFMNDLRFILDFNGIKIFHYIYNDDKIELLVSFRITNNTLAMLMSVSDIIVDYMHQIVGYIKYE